MGDDFTILTAVDLKKELITLTNSESDAVKKYSDERKMLLNPIKTKTMIFNTMKNHYVLPIIQTDEGKELEVVEEHKISGHIVLI